MNAMSGSTTSRRRILFVSPSLAGGGAERNIVWLANYFAENSTDCALVSISGESADAYQLDSRVNRVALSLDTETRSFFHSVAANIDRYRQLRKSIKAFQPDIVVSFVTSANVISVFAARSLSIPVIVSERNYPPAMRLRSYWKWLRRHTYRLSDVVVSQTELGAQWLRQNTSSKKVLVVPNPVIHPVISTAPTLLPNDYVNENVKVLLAVGNASRQKGFDILVHAFGKVSDQFNDWCLVIIGDGTPQALKELIADQQLHKKIIVPGRAGNMAAWYSRADVFVLSSRYEGFPNVLLEAMASGVPVVSTDCNTGPADIIDSGVNGLLTPTEDPDAMAAALEKLMSDEILRLKLGSSAKEVQQRFSPQSIYSCWIQIIETILSNKESK